jgi:hypothetical protein
MMETGTCPLTEEHIMDAERFDGVVRSLAVHSPRRKALGLTLGGLFGAVALTSTEARKKKKRKKKKCKSGKKKCGKSCIPVADCCSDCGELGTCEDGACLCLSGSKPCNGSCIPVGSCCASADCGPNAACANGACTCVSGFKECEGTCISLEACCAGEGICGEDADGGCTCETQNGGGLVCHKDAPFSLVEACTECPNGMVCINQEGNRRCYKLCGAS